MGGSNWAGVDDVVGVGRSLAWVRLAVLERVGRFGPRGSLKISKVGGGLHSHGRRPNYRIIPLSGINEQPHK